MAKILNCDDLDFKSFFQHFNFHIYYKIIHPLRWDSTEKTHEYMKTQMVVTQYKLPKPGIELQSPSVWTITTAHLDTVDNEVVSIENQL